MLCTNQCSCFDRKTDNFLRGTFYSLYSLEIQEILSFSNLIYCDLQPNPAHVRRLARET